MNRGVKIGLITFGAAVVTYGTFKVIQLQRIKNSVKNYTGDTEKRALIYQICAAKGIPFNEQNINQYINKSVDELNVILETSIEPELSDDAYGYTVGISDDEYGYSVDEYGY